MSINGKHGVRYVSVGDLLEEDLYIPPYQRPYRWEPATALDLFEDLRRESGSSSSYVLGSVILHKDDEGLLNIVDGQQRLLTLTILLKLLDAAKKPDASAEVPKQDETDGETVASAEVPKSDEDPDAPIVVVRRRLAGRVKTVQEPGELADFIREQCEMIRVETDNADEAFRVFDSQNYRGKALLPHDLLKAHHLREMRCETEPMMAAVVETWEAVPDAELDRLFSTYLWRIHQWSRGSAAPRFSAHNVGVFEGITARNGGSPMSRYHLAAQMTIPILTAWNGNSREPERDEMRSRFQLDAPVQAGRPFFEMVSFMLGELKRLRNEEGYSDEDWAKYASSDQDLNEDSGKSKFRYVSELYLAALLYYSNKFGDGNLDQVKPLLFRWAYSLRTRLKRVQMVSVDNHAKQLEHGKSAFVLLRNAEDPSEIWRLNTRVEEHRSDDKFMHELRGLLNELGV